MDRGESQQHNDETQPRHFPLKSAKEKDQQGKSSNQGEIFINSNTCIDRSSGGPVEG
jgi:hypothetical protein